MSVTKNKSDFLLEVNNSCLLQGKMDESFCFPGMPRAKILLLHRPHPLFFNHCLNVDRVFTNRIKWGSCLAGRTFLRRVFLWPLSRDLLRFKSIAAKVTPGPAGFEVSPRGGNHHVRQSEDFHRRVIVSIDLPNPSMDAASQ